MLRIVCSLLLILLLGACASPRLPPVFAWLHHSHEYRALTEAIYQNAWRRINALNRQGRLDKRWGVILDIDEALLNNTVFQAQLWQSGAGFSQAAWTEWVQKEEATLVPGALEFVNKVKALGGLLILVSNRHQDNAAVTRRNLEKLSLTYDGLYLRADNSDKYPRWQQSIADWNYQPVLWLGDQISDFPAFAETTTDAVCPPYQHALSYKLDRQQVQQTLRRETGRCLFVLPNPLYGAWQ